MSILEPYDRFKAAGNFVAPPDIRRKAKLRSTQKKRRLAQRRGGGKKGGKGR